jgi:transposase InsO family protein
VGHPSKDGVKQLTKAVEGIEVDEGEIPFCDTCAKSKITRLPFPKATSNRATQPLERIHTDICTIGPGFNNYRYFITFIDDYSRFVHIYLLRKKSEAYKSLLDFKTLVENQQGSKIKIIRSDNAPEFIEGPFKEILDKSGIKLESTTPYSPQQNGVAERYNRTVTEMARSMLIDANLSNHFWPLAIECANHIKNRLTHASLPPNITPYEAFNRSKPDISYFRLFGSKCFAPTFTHQHKMNAKGVEGLFMGYAPRSKAYLFWDKTKRDIYIRRDLIFENQGIVPTHAAGENAKERVDYGTYMPLFDNPTKEFISENELNQKENDENGKRR